MYDDAVYADLSIHPIYTHLHKVIDALRNNKIVVLVAPTGTGKTAAVPPLLVRLGEKVFMTVPKRNYAIGAFNTWEYFYGNEFTIGIAEGGDVRYKKDTQLVVMTIGHIKRKMLDFIHRGKCMDFTNATVLIIDEAHEQTIDNIETFTLWRECEKAGAVMPKLLLMSATASLDMFPDAAPVIVEVKNYEIEETYHHKNYKIKDFRKGEVYKEIAEIVAKAHYDLKSEGEMDAFIIFIPGEMEIKYTLNELKNILNEKDDVKFYSIMSFTSETIRDEAIGKEVIEGKRKIILATNTLEASVTINNLVYVFDLLLNKVSERTPLNGTTLKTKFVSKAKANQRRGRTGRTKPGFLYRFCTKDFFDSLPDQDPSELDLMPIDPLMLDYHKVGFNPYEILKNNLPVFSEELSLKIKETDILLRRLGLIRDEEHRGTVLTKAGSEISNIKLGTRSAYFFRVWQVLGGDILQGIIIAAMIDQYQNIPVDNMPIKEGLNPQEKKAEKIKLINEILEPYKSFTSIGTLLEIWNNIDFKNISTWAHDKKFDVSYFKNVVKLVEEISKKYNVKDPRQKVKINTNLIKKAFTLSFFDFVLITQNNRKVSLVRDDEYSIEQEYGFCEEKEAATIIPIIIRSVGQKYIVSLYVNIYEDLEELENNYLGMFAFHLDRHLMRKILTRIKESKLEKNEIKRNYEAELKKILDKYTEPEKPFYTIQEQPKEIIFQEKLEPSVMERLKKALAMFN